MRAPIRRLPPYIASLIAAGEVIKRPEDIVRELVDNSIDAGAKQIEISITQGGLETIQIRDNGTGIPQDELSLALMHHATNKIQAVEDIEQVQTLGFRGEALASISAVARVKLSSRTEDSTHGWEITTKPGHPSLPPKPVSHPIGTTISVTDLFHHIPARRRFLRTAPTEFARIHQWVKCLSLNHAKLAFSLEHNKRSVLKCLIPPHTVNHQLSRLATLYGHDFAKVAIPIEQIEGSFSLSGWLSPPDFSRSQSDWQYFYVNGRLIKDKTISHAVKQGYQDVLYRDRHPVVVLFLQVDGTEVDFNVHPAKAEVRFRQPQLIYDFVYKRIKQVLSNPSALSSKPPELIEAPPTSSDELLKEAISHISFSSGNYRDNSSLAKQQAIQEGQSVSMKNTHLLSPSTLSEHSITPHQSCLSNEAATGQESLGHPLAQLHGAYILAQNDKGLVIIDAHAAHERILYEQLKASFTQNSPHKQRLLVPLILKLTTAEMELAELHYELFKRVGFEYKKTDPEALTIQAVPPILSNTPTEALIRDVLSDLQANGLSMRLEAQQNRLLSTLACRQAIHANRLMSLKEMNQLLRQIETTPHSGQCNHGRPTLRQITLSELDSWFLRGR